MARYRRQPVLGDPLDADPGQAQQQDGRIEPGQAPAETESGQEGRPQDEQQPGSCTAESLEDRSIQNGSPRAAADSRAYNSEPEPDLEVQQQRQKASAGNDTGLGRPDPEPDPEAELEQVSAEDIQQLRQEQEELQRQFEEKLLELEKTGLKIPGFISKVALWVGVFLGAVLGLFLLNQGLRFAGQISGLDLPWNALAIAGFALFVGVILLIAIRLANRLLAFRSLTRFDLKALNLLAERRRFRLLAEKKQQEARTILTGYIQDFGPQQIKDRVIGLKTEERSGLLACRDRLLDSQGYMDAASWLQDFEANFVQVLDKTARSRIRAYTRSVALGTAASPIKFIDQLIVLYAAFKMISELMQIYNLRPALGQSAAILARSIIQAYLSGVIGEQSEAGLESFADYYESIFGEISFATGLSAATEATRYILPKASEGALNGFLLWRLGRQAQRMVRPL